MEEPKKTFKQRLFSGSGWAILTVFSWELVEEGLENVIAYCISSAIGLFVVKALSTFGIIVATQGIKIGIKRLAKILYPFIKNLTYREGDDKVKLLRNYWDKVWGNKITGTSIGLGFAGISWFQTLIPFLTGCWWTTLIVFVVFFNLGIFFGGETLKQIQERLAEATLKKEEKAIIKEAQHRLAEAKKLEQEKQQVQKSEEQLRAEREREARVQQAMIELQQKQKEKVESGK